MNGNGLMLNGIRYMLTLITKLRYLLLRFALPKQQFYLQGDGFHSVFHPIVKPLLSRTQMEDVDGTENQDSNE